MHQDLVLIPGVFVARQSIGFLHETILESISGVHSPLVIGKSIAADLLGDQIVLAGLFLRRAASFLHDEFSFTDALHSLIEAIHSRVEALLLVGRQLAHPCGSVHGVLGQIDG